MFWSDENILWIQNLENNEDFVSRRFLAPNYVAGPVLFLRDVRNSEYDVKNCLVRTKFFILVSSTYCTAKGLNLSLVKQKL